MCHAERRKKCPPNNMQIKMCPTGRLFCSVPENIIQDTAAAAAAPLLLPAAAAAPNKLLLFISLLPLTAGAGGQRWKLRHYAAAIEAVSCWRLRGRSAAARGGRGGCPCPLLAFLLVGMELWDVAEGLFSDKPGAPRGRGSLTSSILDDKDNIKSRNATQISSSFFKTALHSLHSRIQKF